MRFCDLYPAVIRSFRLFQKYNLNLNKIQNLHKTGFNSQITLAAHSRVAPSLHISLISPTVYRQKRDHHDIRDEVLRDCSQALGGVVLR